MYLRLEQLLQEEMSCYVPSASGDSFHNNAKMASLGAVLLLLGATISYMYLVLLLVFLVSHAATC